jgi:O-antigen/teichoic acid export membrane protein
MSEERIEDPLRAGPDEDDVPRRLGVSALAHDAAIYGATRVLIKSLAFILVPVYARFLSVEEFGILELVLATGAFVDVLIAANMDGVFARYYFDRDSPEWRRNIITLYLWIESIYPAVVIGLGLAFSDRLSDRILGTPEYATLFMLVLVDVYLTNIVDLPMNLLRLRRKPVTFAAYSLTRGGTQIAFTVLLVVVFTYGVKGILVASLVSVCVAFVLTLPVYIRDLTRNVDWRVGREMISFAWPGIIGGLAFYTLNLVDRFFVQHYDGATATGLYGTAFRYSQVVLVGVIAFRLGWSQWHYSWLHSGRHPEMVARGGLYYYFAAGFLAVLVSAWILPIFHLLMPSRYWDATEAVAPLALAAVATGAYSLYTVGLAVRKRQRIIPVLAVAGAAVAVGLYFLLIPPYSFRGAAWATATAMAVLAALVYAVSNRMYPIPWDWRRVGTVVAVMVGLCIAAVFVDREMAFRASLPIRLAITAAYPLLLFVLGFFPPGDLQTAWERVRRRSQPKSRPSSS